MTAHEPGHGSFPSAFKREPVPRAEPALFITRAPVNSQLLHYLCRQLTVAFPSLPLVPLSRSRIFQCPNACLDYIAPATWPAPFFNRPSGLSIGFLKLSHCVSRLYPWPISLVISFCLRPYPRWILLVFIIVIAPSTLGGFVGLSPTLSIGKLSRGAFFGCGPIRPLSSRALLVGGHSQSIAKLPLWASPGRSESRPLSSRTSLVRHYFHFWSLVGCLSIIPAHIVYGSPAAQACWSSSLEISCQIFGHHPFKLNHGRSCPRNSLLAAAEGGLRAPSSR